MIVIIRERIQKKGVFEMSDQKKILNFLEKCCRMHVVIFVDFRKENKKGKKKKKTERCNANSLRTLK